MNARADIAPIARSSLALVRDVMQLAKPRVTVMVVLTALGGMWVATRTTAASLTWTRAVIALGGISLIVGSANALNMYLERHSDGLMERTKNRPLPAGRMAPMVALWFGVVLAAVSLPLLAVLVGWQTAALATLAWLIYVFVYTPMKPITSLALVVGAVPGAMPPLLGWTATTGSVGWPGLALFGVLFFWQIPHFVAIATFRASEYRRAGIKVLPLEKGDRNARWQAVAHLVALVVVSVALVPLGVGGTAYLVSALVCGGAFLAVAVRGLLPGAGERWARSLFFASLIYLPVLFAAIMLSA